MDNHLRIKSSLVTMLTIRGNAAEMGRELSDLFAGNPEFDDLAHNMRALNASVSHHNWRP